ncbi:MAG: FKBP-type peptidyl-prolyl cis-trans isomerase [Gammaproteobacteria bacterium]|nr:FKBP-type peptidyl-prolyl cis-trans isomerase [Gammaproteobacteria bacterium]
MRRLLPTLALGLLCTATYAATTLDSDTAKLSYSMGYKTGEAMKAQSIVIDTNDFAQGLQGGYTGQKSALSDQEMQTVLTNMQKQMVTKMQQKYTEAAQKNLQDGQEFLAKNAKVAGVVTLPSGLQYLVVNPGNGASPTANDTVTVNYEGKLINGKVFDSSYQRGTPATFKVGGVIKGWQEALQLMKPGATWMLYIPSSLAYGPQGSMGAIGPNETLIFKVDLISIKK